MKIKGAAIFLLLMISVLVQAQDLIVTVRGDSANVRISSIEREGLYISRSINGRWQRDYIPRDSLSYFERNFYFTNAISGQITSKLEKYRIGIMAGASMQTGRYSVNDYSFPESDQYLAGLQWGYMLGMQGTWFFTNVLGAGLRYHYMHAENLIHDVTLTNSGADTTQPQVITGDLQDDIRINFIGPEFVIRIVSPGRKMRYNTTFAFGIMTYHNNYIRKDSYKIDGINMGMNLAFSPEYMITKNLALGAELALVMGSVTRYYQDDGKGTIEISLKNRNAISMTRLDLSIGIRWIW